MLCYRGAIIGGNLLQNYKSFPTLDASVHQVTQAYIHLNEAAVEIINESIFGAYPGGSCSYTRQGGALCLNSTHRYLGLYV